MNLYLTRIVPFEGVSKEESKTISCPPVMMWREPGTDYYYPAELPLYYKCDGGVKANMYYLCDQMTPEEQKRFKDKMFIMLCTRDKTTKVYPSGVKSRKRTRSRNKEGKEK